MFLDVVDGDTIVQTHSGDLVAEHLLGDARIKSGSGDVVVRRAQLALVVTPAAATSAWNPRATARRQDGLGRRHVL